MQTYQEFITETLNKTGAKNFKVRNSIGVYDIYKYLRKNKWKYIGSPVSEHQFYSVIRGVNKLLADELMNGESVMLPARMGTLELSKREVGAYMSNGKLKVTYPIDWENTIKLWYKDEEAKRDKILLRSTDRYVYHVRYNKYKAVYDNKTFYAFVLNRFIKLGLKKNIKKGEIETLW